MGNIFLVSHAINFTEKKKKNNEIDFKILFPFGLFLEDSYLTRLQYPFNGTCLIRTSLLVINIPNFISICWAVASPLYSNTQSTSFEGLSFCTSMESETQSKEITKQRLKQIGFNLYESIQFGGFNLRVFGSFAVLFIISIVFLIYTNKSTSSQNGLSWKPWTRCFKDRLFRFLFSSFNIWASVLNLFFSKIFNEPSLNLEHWHRCGHHSLGMAETQFWRLSRSNTLQGKVVFNCRLPVQLRVFNSRKLNADVLDKMCF